MGKSLSPTCLPSPAFVDVGSSLPLSSHVISQMTKPVSHEVAAVEKSVVAAVHVGETVRLAGGSVFVCSSVFESNG